MQLLVRTLQYLFKKKLRKHQKKNSAAPTSQNSSELKIHIKNVALDTPVYYSVGEPWRIFFSYLHRKPPGKCVSHTFTVVESEP